MRIPKFLILFSHTRLWRYKWRILACAPFVLAIVIYASYMIFNHLAKRDYLAFVQSWEAKGESTDANQVFPKAPPEDQDFYHHPAILAERNDAYSLPLGAPKKVQIPGFSHNSSDYNHTGKGNYKMGVATDITYWLKSTPKPKSPRSRRRGRRKITTPSPTPPIPLPPALTEKETAVACLKLLKIYDSRLQKINEASQRPSAHIPTSIEEDPYNSSWSDHYRIDQNIATTFQFRAKLRVMAGDAQGAAKDILTLIQLGQHCEQSPALIGFLISTAIKSLIEEPLWHGLKNHLWDDVTLAKLDRQFAKIDEPKRFIKNMRQEVIFTTSMVNKVIADPQYMERQNAELIDNWAAVSGSSWSDQWGTIKQKTIPSGLYIRQGTWTLRTYDSIVFYPNGVACERVTMEQADMAEKINPPFIFPKIFLQGPDSTHWIGRQIHKALQSQANIHNIRTAIALERYRLKHQIYPKTLTQLVPEYLPRVLEDVITQQPLNYQIKDDGTPIIYSIGANQIDDHGNPHRRAEHGDWAWMYSPPKGFSYTDYSQRN